MAQKDNINAEEIRVEVQKYYGRMASKASSHSAAGCCSPKDDHTPAIYETAEVENLPIEVRTLSAGCGDPITLAELEPGQTVLDLGSGGGIDCFLAAERVGPEGYVIGVDMTSEMLARARANQAHMSVENVEFRLGEIEHLPVPDNQVDVVISNCVINLSPDKPQVFLEAFRVLKSGGRLAVSDIVMDGPLPPELKDNLEAWSGCVAGAIDRQDYIQELENAGFVEIEIASRQLNPELTAEFLQEQGSQDSGNGNEGDRKPMANIGGERIVINSEEFKPPFSARIIARKP